MLTFGRPRLRKARFVDRAPADAGWRAVHAAADANVPDFERAFLRMVRTLRRAVDPDVLVLPEGAASFLAVPREAEQRMEADALALVLRTLRAGALAAARTLERQRRGTRVDVAKQEEEWRRVGPGTYERVVDGVIFRARRVSDGWALESDATGFVIGRFDSLGEAQSGLSLYLSSAPEARRLALTMRLDLKNPFAVRAASEQAASLVRAVTQETREAVRAVIVRAQAEGLAIPQQAALIRDLVGLTERQAVAALNLRAELVAQGLPRRIVDERVREYRDRAIAQRATVIARNETLAAANRGQDELWRQAVEQGFLPQQPRRKWLIARDERTCFTCRPMHGQVRVLGDPFVSPYDGTTVLHPPAHVQCRCTLVLVVDDV